MTTNAKIEAIKRRVEVDRGNVVDENRIPMHIIDREELLKEVERLRTALGKIRGSHTFTVTNQSPLEIQILTEYQRLASEALGDD